LTRHNVSKTTNTFKAVIGEDDGSDHTILKNFRMF